MNLKKTVLALPILLSATFNGAVADNSDPFLYQNRIEASSQRNDTITAVRYYDFVNANQFAHNLEAFEILPVFSNDGNQNAHAIRNSNGLGILIEYWVVGDDFFQVETGTFFRAGSLRLNTGIHCTSEGLGTVSLVVDVRPSMSDLAKTNHSLVDMEHVLSDMFNDYVRQELSSIEYADISGNWKDQVILPALTNTAREFESRYSITIADRPDLVSEKVISVNNLSNLAPRERERICPNPSQKL